jgi:hypothetical protein
MIKIEPSLQTILFNRNMWTLREAKKWLSEHGKGSIKPVHKTKNEYRFRQAIPIKGAHYYSKEISPGILFVFQYYDE